ncbi:MAG: flavoprotein [Pirellulaceae bacterium]
MVTHHYQNFLAPIASGSFLTGGMVVCPCSGGTLSGIVHGASGNLVHPRLMCISKSEGGWSWCHEKRRYRPFILTIYAEPVKQAPLYCRPCPVGITV